METVPIPPQPQPLPPPATTPPAQSTSQSTSQCMRNSVMTTTELYHTREWQMDEIEVLVNKQISDCGEDLNVDEINLETPRWCIRETSNGAFSGDGMEDLSDDVFIKRHARLEHAEKKRKKWDVQRIREIRNIERLKRRHCKNEIDNNEQTAESMTSFYPSPENVKYVQVAAELPVVAFGEFITASTGAEFSLPWDHQYRDTPFTDAQSATISNVDHTTIVFRAKKRPARRVTSTQLPKAPSKARSSKRTKR